MADRRIHLAAIACLPFVLLLLNDSWAFTPAESGLDPWFYTGLFVHFPEHLREFAGTYYAARLPHVLAGASAYQLLEPPAASYAVRILYWYLGVFSLYGLVRSTLASHLAAFVTSVLFGTCIYFLWAIGWDYVDGACVAFLLAAAFFLCTGSGRHHHWRQALGGVFQLFAVSTYIGLLMFVPLQLANAFVVRRRESFRPLSPVAVAMGWVGGFAFLGTVNLIATGEFNYIAPQLQAAVTQSGGRDEWITPILSWLPRATWLFMPGLMALCAVAIVGVAAATTAWPLVWRERGVSESTQFLLALGTLWLAELNGFWFLQLSFVTSYLMPFWALVLGAVLARALSTARPWRDGPLAATALAAAVIPFVPPLTALYPRCTPVCSTWAPLAWVCFSIVGALLVIVIVTRHVAATTLGVILLGAVNLVFADPRAIDVPDPGRRAAHAAVVAASTTVAARHPTGRVRFWYDYAETLGPVYRSIASTYIWSFSLIGEDFPRRAGTLAETTLTVAPANIQLSPGDTIVVLTSQAASRVIESVRSHGVNPRLMAEDRFRIGGAPFSVISLELLATTGHFETIPFKHLQAEGGVVTPSQGTVTVVTPPAPYGYAAGVALRPLLKDAAGRVSLVLDVDVVRGDVGLCVLNLERSSCIASKTLDERSRGTLYLSIGDATQASRLIIETLAKPESAEVTISRIGLLYEDSR